MIMPIAGFTGAIISLRQAAGWCSFNRFSERGLNPTECRTIVYYHPDSQATPFTLEMI
jgi:hypothetical protein